MITSVFHTLESLPDSAREPATKYCALEQHVEHDVLIKAIESLSDDYISVPYNQANVGMERVDSGFFRRNDGSWLLVYAPSYIAKGTEKAFVQESSILSFGEVFENERFKEVTAAYYTRYKLDGVRSCPLCNETLTGREAIAFQQLVEALSGNLISDSMEEPAIVSLSKMLNVNTSRMLEAMYACSIRRLTLSDNSTIMLDNDEEES